MNERYRVFEKKWKPLLDEITSNDFYWYNSDENNLIFDGKLTVLKANFINIMLLNLIKYDSQINEKKSRPRPKSRP